MKEKMTLARPDLLDRGRQLETEGESGKAAALYQAFFEKHPEDTIVTKRLLIQYRKLKEYRKELRAIDAALAARKQVLAMRQKEWVLEHPKAAKASRALLRAVERPGKDQSGSTNPEIAALIKRKQGLLKKLRRHPI
jgi:hypothetical protein